MKTRILKSIIMMVAFAPIGAGAQKINTTVDTSDFQACKSYLDEHPLDTIVNGDVKVFVVNGQVVCTGLSVSEPTLKAIEKRTAEKVERHGNITEVTYGNGTSSFVRTTSGQVSYADKVAVVNDQKLALKPCHLDWEGNLRHRVYLELAGGASYMPKPHCWAPLVTAELGYETCHFFFGVQAEGTRFHYTKTAEADGSYTTLILSALGGYKFWQDHLCRNFVAAIAAVGYGRQETDDEGAVARSYNWGFAAKTGLRGKIYLSYHFGLTWELVAELQPWVEHTKTLEDQKMDNIGGSAKIGIQYKF